MTLDANQFDLWRNRVDTFLKAAKHMREINVDSSSTQMVATGWHDGLLDQLPTILQRCENVTEVALQECTLSNTAVTSLCQQMRDRLASLDLSRSRGFDDNGIKALAAYCTKMQTLRLAGCKVSDDGFTVIAKHCTELAVVDVQGSSVTQDSLKLLPHTCKVISRVSLSACAEDDVDDDAEESHK